MLSWPKVVRRCLFFSSRIKVIKVLIGFVFQEAFHAELAEGGQAVCFGKC